MMTVYTFRPQLIMKIYKGADDYASAAELNLHEPIGGIGDGRSDR